jgi:hypothetical protein
MPLPSLEDTLTTDYIGAYVGFEDSIPMGKGGLRLGLSGQAGIYYADTQYDGTSSDGFTPTSLSLEDDDVAAILSGKIELTQAFGNIEVSLFGKGEWYSYVPTVIYNDKDAGSVQSTVLNAKTSIEDDEAESYTVGGKIAVKLN